MKMEDMKYDLKILLMSHVWVYVLVVVDHCQDQHCQLVKGNQVLGLRAHGALGGRTIISTNSFREMTIRHTVDCGNEKILLEDISVEQEAYRRNIRSNSNHVEDALASD